MVLFLKPAIKKIPLFCRHHEMDSPLMMGMIYLVKATGHKKPKQNYHYIGQGTFAGWNQWNGTKIQML